MIRPASDIVLKEAEQKVAKIALDALNNEDDNDDVFILNDQNKNQINNQFEETQELIPNINQPFTFKQINSDKNENTYQLNKNKPINKFGGHKNNPPLNNKLLLNADESYFIKLPSDNLYTIILCIPSILVISRSTINK